MRARTFQTIVVGMILLGVGGCTTITDPNTGEPVKVLDPNSTIVTTGEAVAQGVSAIGPFFGTAGGLIAGIATGALAAWKKIKPSLTTATTQAEHYHAAASAAVSAIEEFKTASPDTWKQLGTLISEQLTNQGIDAKVVENVIRGLRGLPAKA